MIGFPPGLNCHQISDVRYVDHGALEHAAWNVLHFLAGNMVEKVREAVVKTSLLVESGVDS